MVRGVHPPYPPLPTYDQQGKIHYGKQSIVHVEVVQLHGLKASLPTRRIDCSTMCIYKYCRYSSLLLVPVTRLMATTTMLWAHQTACQIDTAQLGAGGHQVMGLAFKTTPPRTPIKPFPLSLFCSVRWPTYSIYAGFFFCPLFVCTSMHTISEKLSFDRKISEFCYI